MSEQASDSRGFVQGWIDKIFTPVEAVKIEGGKLVLTHVDKAIETIDLSSLVGFAEYRKGFLASDLILKSDGETRVFKWLRARDSERFVEILNNEIAQAIAQDIKRKTVKFLDYVFLKYPRESWAPELTSIASSIHEIHADSLEKVRPHLESQDIESMKSISNFHPFTIEMAQMAHETYQLEQRSSFFDRVESNPLTHEQRLAVIRNDDRNMVLAAAGTGKTSVIVAKALDLIDRGLADPSEVLVLAYNKSAAEEVRERVKLRAESSGMTLVSMPDVSTFHALGLRIIGDTGSRTYMSEFTEEGSTKLNRWVTAWVTNYVKTKPKRMIEILSLIPEPVDPFTFETTAEYEAYVQSTGFRTLADEYVKGYQELLIANHLFMQGIRYEYEAPYKTKQRLEVGFDYQPDFYLTDLDVYLEHFGISRDGSTRADIDAVAYNASIESKRSLHKDKGTRLIETYHYQWVEETLLSGLDEQLKELEAEFSPVGSEDLFEILNNSGKVSEWSQRFLSCLTAIRTERLDRESLLARLKTAKIYKADLWKQVLGDLLDGYVAELKSQDRIDFDDMILKAIDALEMKTYEPRWKYILVDEFQDISEARMDFIRALVNCGPKTSLTVVGDDWQSIYRFNGGKLELTTRFETLVGSRKLTRLQKTFRYNNSIAHTAGSFVMKNPEQYEKQISVHTQVESPQVFLLDDQARSPDPKMQQFDGLFLRIEQIVSKIRQHEKASSIAIIGRYNATIKEARRALHTKGYSANLEFWTFHKSKGLEADYVILAGLTQGFPSFPDGRHNETILDALLPSLDPYPYAEERRLLYVGLTRARHKVYIIGDSKSPSKFIDELMNQTFQIEVRSKLFTEEVRKRFKCHHCAEGYFQSLEGKHGQFFVCSTGLGCPARKARTCKSCGSPSIDGRNNSVCNNAQCRDTLPICPKCGRPMIERESRHGVFWSCFGFVLKEDRCFYKVKTLPSLEEFTAVS